MEYSGLGYIPGATVGVEIRGVASVHILGLRSGFTSARATFTKVRVRVKTRFTRSRPNPDLDPDPDPDPNLDPNLDHNRVETLFIRSK